jgi:hypothetical protein
VSAAVREAIRHLDGRWVRLWLAGGAGPVAGIVRLRTDDAGFLLEQPGGAVLPLESAPVAYWSGRTAAARWGRLTALGGRPGPPRCPGQGRRPGSVLGPSRASPG